MTMENRTLGCFRLLDEVGRGSQGVVYKAVCERDGFEDVPVGTTVALNVLSAHGGEKSWLAKLQSRVDELRRLAHPGVARCFGYFCEPGPFGDMHVLVTEWLEGETLKDRLSRNPQGLDADEVLRIGEQLLSALVYVSSKGVAHRNIKPGHVFLCANGSVKVSDFRMPQQEEVVVPPERNKNAIFDYMAPDFVDPQFRGDEQSDIFSVGVCLHEMLTGKLPYRFADGRSTDVNKTLEFLSRWHRVNEGDDSIKINPLVNRLLAGASDVLAKALRPKRAERYATFADFAAAFKGIHFRALTHEDNTWRLLQYVGRGGFGEVFKARDVKTGQLVAIKHFWNIGYAGRFRREARVLSSLNDSGIARFITFFEEKWEGCERAFLVMEFLDRMPGKTLRDELGAAGGAPLPRDLVLRAFARYAHGLSVLHAKGVGDCDIRPVNLYFPTDAIDRSVIMDLGIVRNNGGTGGRTGIIDYLPPEAITAERWSPGMDVYALGLCLYEALSGKTAYSRLPPALADGSNAAGVRMFYERSKNMVPPTLDESSYSDLPDLVRLVREMTEPDATKRLKDATEVERRLRALLVEQDDDDAARWDDSEPQTIYAAPSYDELEKVEAPSCLPDFDEERRAMEKAVRRARWFAWMRKYLVGVPLLILALSCALGCIGGAFWLCEACVRGSTQGLEDSLAIRVALLFPWLIGIVFAEARLGRLPDVLTGGCLLSGIVISIFADGVSLISSIGAVAAGAAVLFPFFQRKAIGSGAVMLFAGTLSFWGIRWFPFALVSFLLMFYPVLLARPVLRRLFAKYDEHECPTSPVVLLAMLNVVAAIYFSNGPCLIGSYVFMAGIFAVAAVVWLLFCERKQHAEVVSTPSSSCAAETVPPHADFNAEDARTVTTTSSESLGSLDATCRDSDDLVSETEDGTDDPSAFLNLHGHATIHGFRLDPSPLVAEGGQGRVFKAECVEEGRLGLRKGEVVALKFVEETDWSPSFEEFEKAVAYLREIKSPHVPRYYGCFRVERRVNGTLKRFRMTVMEYLDGADLGYRVKVRSPNFYADEIMYVLDQLLEGLCELAEAGVIHRDIKPSNVFICRDGTVKLIDFDTALIRGIDLCPKNRKIVGTPEFAAPDYLVEGFRGDEISDVFSVGMTLYYMVHGVSPHRAIGTVDGRMDENIFRAFWFKRHAGSGSQGWWKWNKNDGYGSPSYAPLLGLQQLFGRSLTADRNPRYGGFEEFRLSLHKVGFRTVQYEGRRLRVVSGIMSVAGPGPCFLYGCGRDADGKLYEIPLDVLHKAGVWRSGTGAWSRMSSMMRRATYKTEICDSKSLAKMRKSFDRVKSLDEWHREIEEENERAMYS